MAECCLRSRAAQLWVPQVGYKVAEAKTMGLCALSPYLT